MLENSKETNGIVSWKLVFYRQDDLPTVKYTSMKKKICSVIICFLTSIAIPAVSIAQDNEGGESPGIKGFWEIETETGRFVARLDQITSVSQHEYIIDGGVKVYECTVDTDGSVTARFYYIEPVGAGNSTVSSSNTFNRLRDVANRVTDKAGVGDAEHLVTKNYPTTTHAKTSEYRLKYKDTIGKIYAHIHRVWAREKGRGEGNKITIRE